MIRGYGYPFDIRSPDPDPNRRFYGRYPFVTYGSQIILRIAGSGMGHRSQIGRRSRGKGYEVSNVVSSELGRNLARGANLEQLKHFDWSAK